MNNRVAIPILCYPLALYQTSSTMNTLPAKHGESSLSVDPRQHGISNTRADHNLIYNIHGDSNTNVGNVSNSYNTIINNIGVEEESSQIQAWLSPLEPDIRHRAVSNRRLDGIGDWVLQRNEFESWRESQGVHWILPCFVMGVKGLARPL